MSAFLLLLLPSAPCPPPKPTPPTLVERVTPLCHYAAAAFALAADGEADDSCAFAWEELRRLALRMEIMDPREGRYLLARPEDFPADLRLLRDRYADLRDAPPLSDCMRLPERAVANDALQFNRRFRQHLEDRRALELPNADALYGLLVETDACYHAWDLARDARTEYYYVTVRRLALKRLKDRLGDRAYYSGVLPPIAPVWAFRRIDP